MCDLVVCLRVCVLRAYDNAHVRCDDCASSGLRLHAYVLRIIGAAYYVLRIVLRYMCAAYSVLHCVVLCSDCVCVMCKKLMCRLMIHNI